MVTADVIIDDGGHTGVVCLCPSARHQLSTHMFECCDMIHRCLSTISGSDDVRADGRRHIIPV